MKKVNFALFALLLVSLFSGCSKDEEPVYNTILFCGEDAHKNPKHTTAFLYEGDNYDPTTFQRPPHRLTLDDLGSIKTTDGTEVKTWLFSSYTPKEGYGDFKMLPDGVYTLILLYDDSFGDIERAWWNCFVINLKGGASPVYKGIFDTSKDSGYQELN